MDLRKLYLIQFTLLVGEYGQNSYLLVKAHCVEEAKKEVHEYFLGYYDEENTDEGFKEAEEYSYNNGDITVEVDTPEVITPDELVEKLLITKD